MKKAIVVGATSAVGRELARLLVKDNYKVGIMGRPDELLQQLKQESPDSYCPEPFDMLDTTLIVEKLEKLTHAMDGLDLVVINAGLAELPAKPDFIVKKQIIDRNITGFTCVADWAFDYFLKQKFGHLVAISLITGLPEKRPASAYTAIKAYQVNYLKSLQQKAQKLKQPIYVSDIRPGVIDKALAKTEEIL